MGCTDRFRRKRLESDRGGPILRDRQHDCLGCDAIRTRNPTTRMDPISITAYSILTSWHRLGGTVQEYDGSGRAKEYLACQCVKSLKMNELSNDAPCMTRSK